MTADTGTRSTSSPLALQGRRLGLPERSSDASVPRSVRSWAARTSCRSTPRAASWRWRVRAPAGSGRNRTGSRLHRDASRCCRSRTSRQHPCGCSKSRPRLQNEVAMLKREIGPLVGGEDRLAFDTTKGLMTVGASAACFDRRTLARHRKTGMPGSLVGNGSDEAVFLRMYGLDCNNDVAAPNKELGPLVGEDNLAFDTAQGAMTVAPQNRATLQQIEQAVARTGMRAEPWSSPSVAEPANCDAAGSRVQLHAEVQEALSVPLPTNLPGGVVYRIHGMDCADEIAALKREVGPSSAKTDSPLTSSTAACRSTLHPTRR